MHKWVIIPQPRIEAMCNLLPEPLLQLIGITTKIPKKQKENSLYAENSQKKVKQEEKQWPLVQKTQQDLGHGY